MAAAEAVWALLKTHPLLLLLQNPLCLRLNWWQLRQVVFKTKIVYLATFLIELILSEEDNAIICPPPFVFDLHWVHYALRVYD